MPTCGRLSGEFRITITARRIRIELICAILETRKASRRRKRKWAIPPLTICMRDLTLAGVSLLGSGLQRKRHAGSERGTDRHSRRRPLILSVSAN